MNPYRIAAIILVIGASLAGSYLIIRSSIPSVPSVSEAQDNPISQPLTQNPVKWLEEATKFLQEPAQNLADTGSFLAENANQGENNSASTSSANLTELVAKSLFGRMQQLDQSGQSPFEGQSFDIQSPDNQKLIQEAVADFKDPSILFSQSVSDKDLKILNDNSAEAKAKYLETTGKIILDNSNESYNNPTKALENWINSSDPSGINQLADAYLKIYNGFLNAPVPSDWLELHRRYTTFLKNAKTIYWGIADFESDPIKSQIFAQLIPEMTKIELGLKQEYYQKSLNLNF